MLKTSLVFFTVIVTVTLLATAACNSEEAGGDDASAKDQSVNDVGVSDATKNDASVDAAFDAGTDAADASTDANDGSDASDANDGSDDASTDAADGGGASDGGSASACNACAQNSCGTPINTCVQDSTCLSWLQCINLCTTIACEATCDAQYPTAKSLFDPVYTCACTNCDLECANNLAPCTHGKDGGA